MDSVFRGRRGTTLAGGEVALAGFRAGRAGGCGGIFCVQTSEQRRQGDTNGLEHRSGTAWRLIAQHEATSMLLNGGLDDAVEVGDDVLPLEIQFSCLQPGPAIPCAAPAPGRR